MFGSKRVARLAPILTFVSAALASGLTPVPAAGQGSYEGTIELSGTRMGPEVTYSASAEVSLPITDRGDSSITAEFLGGEAPDATVTISQWDESHTQKSPDSDGKFTSWKCSLAERPTKIQMTPSGVLYLDLDEKQYTLSITLLSTGNVKFDCVNSRSGPYKKENGVLLYVGTATPGAQVPLPFIDADLLAGHYTLMPTAETKGEYGPIVQDWNLQLAP